VDQRGGAPGTRETDLLRPLHLVQHINAVVLTGGSAFGLAAADGVMRWLEERGIGFPTLSGVVPIVPAAVIYDLTSTGNKRRPDAAMGYAACENASSEPVAEGRVGGGAGATVAKMFGTPALGGVGSAAVEIGGGLIVAALIVVNALGEILSEDGSILVGARNPANPTEIIPALEILRMPFTQPPAPTNTVIGIVATNAALDKEGTNKVAQMAHDGLARAVRPAHMPFDGDTIFAAATGEIQGEGLGAGFVGMIGAFAAEVTAAAIRRAVRAAAG